MSEFFQMTVNNWGVLLLIAIVTAAIILYLTMRHFLAEKLPKWLSITINTILFLTLFIGAPIVAFMIPGITAAQIENVKLTYHPSGQSQIQSAEFDQNWKATGLLQTAQLTNTSVQKGLQDAADDNNLQDQDQVQGHVKFSNFGLSSKLVVDHLERMQDGTYVVVK